MAKMKNNDKYFIHFLLFLKTIDKSGAIAISNRERDQMACESKEK